jgi:AcrR family transcriptional regulator
MDRRQRKTKLAIFHAFTSLLAQKDYSQITVGEIIEKADVGRATFYAHFETKDYLLKAFCQELFCHIFDTIEHNHDHRHIFDCEGSDSVFAHLFQHFQRNDNQLLTLLSSQNNGLFLDYFRSNLVLLIESQLPYFASRKPEGIPDSYWQNHIAATFVETLRWWISRGLQESAETIAGYFLYVI